MSTLFSRPMPRVRSILSTPPPDPRDQWRSRLLMTSPFRRAQQDEILDLREASECLKDDQMVKALAKCWPCPMRHQLLDELTSDLHLYELSCNVGRQARVDHHTKTIEAVVRLGIELDWRIDLQAKGKLPYSSRLKGSHQKTLLKNLKELTDILRGSTPEE